MNAKDEYNDEQLGAAIRCELTESICDNLKKAFDKWREFLAEQLAVKIIESLSSMMQDVSGETHADWIGIESLSRLRSLVGGRFQSLKQKWTEAGLPLRAHRGDRWKDFKLNQRGWIDLSNWVLKQGFEARLTPNSEDFLFEIRELTK